MRSCHTLFTPGTRYIPKLNSAALCCSTLLVIIICWLFRTGSPGHPLALHCSPGHLLRRLWLFVFLTTWTHVVLSPQFVLHRVRWDAYSMGGNVPFLLLLLINWILFTAYLFRLLSSTLFTLTFCSCIFYWLENYKLGKPTKKGCYLRIGHEIVVIIFISQTVTFTVCSSSSFFRISGKNTRNVNKWKVREKI